MSNDTRQGFTPTEEDMERLALALINVRVPSPVEPDATIELSGMMGFLDLMMIARAALFTIGPIIERERRAAWNDGYAKGHDDGYLQCHEDGGGS